MTRSTLCFSWPAHARILRICERRQGARIRLVSISASSGRSRPQGVQLVILSRASLIFCRTRNTSALCISIATSQPRPFNQGSRSHLLKAIHAQESREAAEEGKGDRRRSAGNKDWASDLVEQAIHETLSYYGFPDIHWQKIRTNNPPGRIMKEVRRRIASRRSRRSLLSQLPPSQYTLRRSRASKGAPLARLASAPSCIKHRIGISLQPSRSASYYSRHFLILLAPLSTGFFRIIFPNTILNATSSSSLR